MTQRPAAPPVVHQPAVPLLDLSRENGSLESEIQAAMAEVCRTGSFVLGPAVEQLEQHLADLAGVSQGIGCASGSDALLLALMAFDIGPGDEVILPSFTFFATASAVTRLGATPVFVDIDPRTYNIDPVAIEAAVTPATKAIIPVHLFGQPADMLAITALAEQHGLIIIEDAAQAVGARYGDRPVCSWGHVGCLSFYPTKNLGGFGDGGMMLTDDVRVAERLRLLRGHGMKPRYIHRVIGINSRLDSLQAAVLNVKLQHLASWTESRQANAKRYMQMFGQTHMMDHVVPPATIDGAYHVWNQFTVRVERGLRDPLRQYLRDQQVGSEIYYPIPLHQQTCFSYLGYRDGSLPHTERAAREVLSLPIFPQLTAMEQQTVVQQMTRFFESDASRLHDYRPMAA
jgi:dTDP-4-amino-4,6-dideoxygalactose transaminase